MDQALSLCFILHTASNQKLDGGKAWEQGYQSAMLTDKVFLHSLILMEYLNSK